MSISLGLDIGSNSVGSAWYDSSTGQLVTATSIFPAGVDESDDKRGEPKNAKRRMTRRTRITLARRSARKRALRLKLIATGLLPNHADEFKLLLESTDPWELRRRGLDAQLDPHEFGRVVLHLSQRRGALGLRIDLAELDEELEDGDKEDGKVKAAISEVRRKMRDRCSRTFGEYVATIRDERVTAITTKDRRPVGERKGPREFRSPIRNKAGSYEHCADRTMIHQEFTALWDRQKSLSGELSRLLTHDLKRALDDSTGDTKWRHRGMLFGQRRQSWDLGTLGRCALQPTERCVPHADMYASRYLVVETINNLQVAERGKETRPLTIEEREKIKSYLSGPLGEEKVKKRKGKDTPPETRRKSSVSVTDLRTLMGWGRSSKTAQYKFNIENDEDREINTDWFSREIVHGAIGPECWNTMTERVREGINRALLKHDPDQEGDLTRLHAGVTHWGGLSIAQADALVAAWKRRPKIDRKRLNMSRKAVRNLLTIMDRAEPWPDPNRPGHSRWLTQIEARKVIAGNAEYKDNTTGEPLNELTRRRYATGAKGATARDRYYMRKHLLRKNGEPIYDPAGLPLAEPPPAPLISNPVVRKAIHEVRRHLVEYMVTFGRKPDEVYVELAREAKMGKVDADRQLFMNRLRNRIRNDIIDTFKLKERSSTQQRAAVDRVILCIQQGGTCPLCGEAGLTARNAAFGEGCEVAHIIPRACGGHNGLANIVLAHKKCNQDMGRNTPRQFWDKILRVGFDEGIAWVEKIFTEIERPKPSDVKSVTGNALWACYFAGRPRRFGPTHDELKIEQFKKDIKDVQGMTERQAAATKYAARQVMSYIADALFDGGGLPERGGTRRIFATDGMWTSRFRREWGLFFDPHQAKAKGLADSEEHERKEKNRGDHRHHAIDASVIAMSRDELRRAWDEREREADRDGVNTADEEVIDNYRRGHPLQLPKPYRNREALRDAVRDAVFNDGEDEKPICHRPVKRRLTGAFHKATQYGAVVDSWVVNGELRRELVQDRVTVRQAVLGEAPADYLKPAHLRVPRMESTDEAISRIARRLRMGKKQIAEVDALKMARKIVRGKGFTLKVVDPKPEKGGVVRDRSLRSHLRLQLEERGLCPDTYSKADLKKWFIRYFRERPCES